MFWSKTVLIFGAPLTPLSRVRASGNQLSFVNSWKLKNLFVNSWIPAYLFIVCLLWFVHWQNPRPKKKHRKCCMWECFTWCIRKSKFQFSMVCGGFRIRKWARVGTENGFWAKPPLRPRFIHKKGHCEHSPFFDTQKYLNNAPAP